MKLTIKWIRRLMAVLALTSKNTLVMLEIKIEDVPDNSNLKKIITQSYSDSGLFDEKTLSRLSDAADILIKDKIIQKTRLERAENFLQDCKKYLNEKYS